MLAAAAALVAGSGASWAQWGLLNVGFGFLVLVGAVQAVNSLLRWRLRHWHIAGLRQALRAEILVGCILPLGIGILGLSTDLPVPLQLGLAILVVVAFLSVCIVELSIAKAVEADPEKHSVARHVATWTLVSRALTGNPRAIEEEFNEIDATRVAPPISWLFTPIRETPLSGARYAMMVALLLPSIALGVGAKTDTAESDAGNPSTARQTTTPKSSSIGKAGKVDKGSGSGSTTPTPRPSNACVAPGEGVPASMGWMRTDFAMLLGVPGSDFKLHATHFVDTPDGVCTRRVELKNGFAFTTQSDPKTGHITSLAVDSLTWGAAFFLAPAAQRVDKLIDVYGAVGGSPRLMAGSGDFYLVWVTRGTIVLVRRTFYKLTGKTEPFTVLPLAVAVAWLERLRERNGWLWPVEKTNADGTRTYELLESADAQDFKITIEYDPKTEMAHTKVGQVVHPYGPNGAHLDERELGTYAAGAH